MNENKINLNEKLSLKEFVELLEYLDRSQAGQNLRLYPDGSSYITNDNGFETDNFNNIYELVDYLRELKRKYDSGELVAFDWSIYDSTVFKK